jgi:NAD(P)-dependent dehydrogenase (short-subunit alcohol dehydrogenase family)
MRAGGGGRIVMIGSMHASFPVAFRSGYAASKAALRTMADCLRAELAPDGIGVSTVQPGSIRTGISARRTIHISAGTPRAQAFERFLEALDDKERAGIEPERVADAVLRAVRSERPRRLYAVAPGAGLTYGLRRVLPDRVVEGLVARAHGLGAAH